MKAKQAMTKREYARHAGLDHGWITRLCKEGRLPVRDDGMLDPEACDRARAATVRPRISAGRGQVPASLTPRPCGGCGGLFTENIAREFANPDPIHFCSRECRDDVRAGKSSEQIRERLRREFLAGGYSRAEVSSDAIFNWVDPDGVMRFPF